MSIEYAKENFGKAAETLQSSDGSDQERLAAAAMYLTRLQPEHLPESIQPEFLALLSDLSHRKPDSPDGETSMSSVGLTEAQASNLAQRVLDIHSSLSSW